MSDGGLQWAEISALFNELAEKNSSERNLHLEKIQATNPQLADELRSLLKTHDSADGFFEEKVPRLFASLAPDPVRELRTGERVLHFEIIKLLGEGSVAKVFLAKDLELERLVALKVSLNQSHEARALANFQLDGIVQVYSEHVVDHKDARLRLICLQFIAGPTLAELIQKIAGPEGNFIQLLESCSPGEVPFEPAALKWRELLQNSTMEEAIVLLGIRLAEVLSQTHARGVLHLDIKPANILLDPYGRPFLSDFNVSTSSANLTALGGTPKYMPPEQARLFEEGANLSQNQVDVRTDVYALGILINEMLAASYSQNSNLKTILERATKSDRAARTSSAKEFALELSSWLRTHLTEKEMTPLWGMVRWLQSFPVRAIISLSVISQLFASFINISYNRLQIVSALSPEQNEIFVRSVLVYNLITYPLLVLLSAYAIRAFYQKPLQSERARRTAVRVPLILILAISFGWLPGAWIFPRVIDSYAGPVSTEIYWQFGASIWLGWLISLTTSLTLALFVLARVIYPKFWTGESELAARELRHCERLNRSMTLISALLPMSAVLIMVLFAPSDYSTAEYRSFKILLLVTIGLGLVNLVLVQRIAQKTDRVFGTLKRPRVFN